MNEQIKEMAQVIAKNVYGAEQDAAYAPNARNASKELFANGYRKASTVAREIFEAIKKLFRQRFSDEVDGEYRINAQEFAELLKKYESEE